MLGFVFQPQWRKWCRKDREHQTAAEVSLSDESELSRNSLIRTNHQGGAGPGPEQVEYSLIPGQLQHTGSFNVVIGCSFYDCPVVMNHT